MGIWCLWRFSLPTKINCPTGARGTALNEGRRSSAVQEYLFETKMSALKQNTSEGPALEDHERNHTGEKSYKGKECGIAYMKISFLLNHHKIHISNLIDVLNVDIFS
ncbi:hypothetical protein QTO34_018784 [Cnephaeus nilssonii]|uniref:C2H2-type domain-containing protein n=1 Tax=Cnephaeus nilssonii TaxID=3371016 RepID=A0AA40HZG6_CNENI|nr:hypothetical protein QTO34_018784 [Eptesicus nilssonii]